MASELSETRSRLEKATRPTDVRVVGAELYLLPVRTRVPLKFGSETLTSVTCARARVQVCDRQGRSAYGWGETPLSVQWAWPTQNDYDRRQEAMVAFSRQMAKAWANFDEWGHPLEIGQAFLDDQLPIERTLFGNSLGADLSMPYLAALLCCSPFDIAVHDAYGNLLGLPVYETYTSQYMNRSLASYLVADEHSDVDFRGKYPADFLTSPRPSTLAAWHLVGGLDPLEPSGLNGCEPNDGHPVLLDDWITHDGLTCLKVKLRGNDAEWDYNRMVQVGEIAQSRGVRWLSADFNCTVTHPSYVNDILDRLASKNEELYEMLLYVEQPFPYELEQHPIDVHSVSARKLLLLDESAHDWRLVKLGRSLGWTGVALKTCKTQTGALLSLCWAKAHGMEVMVQDLTNPMLALIPHALLAAHAGTIMGVEANAMQFYPEASSVEAKIHPGLFARRDGHISLSTIRGPGFGYRAGEIARQLPEPIIRCGEMAHRHAPQEFLS